MNPKSWAWSIKPFIIWIHRLPSHMYPVLVISNYSLPPEPFSPSCAIMTMNSMCCSLSLEWTPFCSPKLPSKSLHCFWKTSPETFLTKHHLWTSLAPKMYHCKSSCDTLLYIFSHFPTRLWALWDQEFYLSHTFYPWSLHSLNTL